MVKTEPLSKYLTPEAISDIERSGIPQQDISDQWNLQFKSKDYHIEDSVSVCTDETMRHVKYYIQGGKINKIEFINFKN